MKMKIIRYLLITITLSASPFINTSQQAKEPITFTRDVAPIFFNSCVECHRPEEAAPMSLLTYKDARPWAKSIREKVANREMPPWHAEPAHGEFMNDRRLTQKEIDTIVGWVDGGANEGNARDLPPAPKFVDGWGIGKPDLVLSMPDEFTLDASGPDEYQYFTIPTNFTEDRYVQAVEARPGNRKIVHHLVAFIQAPAPPDNPTNAGKRAEMEKDSILYRDGFLRRTKDDAPVYNDGCQLPNGGGGWGRDVHKRTTSMPFLTVYAPGRNPNIWEPGTVKRIPAGAKVVLQVHYSKVVGSVQKDRSSVGLIFAKGRNNSKLQTTDLIYNAYLQIPAGAERHKATACWSAPRDIRLTALMPHMHFRGAAMEIKAVYPDGKSAILLNVPKYEFAWQTNYSLKQPLLIPKGTKIITTGFFDNSAKNKYNPNPDQAVRWGDPSYDEMLACFLEYTDEEIIDK
jgi:Copper type II ascorbate-dependent monooxygenase, C-terminal domain